MSVPYNWAIFKLAIAVVCWSPGPHYRLPRKILWSENPEDVALISGAMRGDVVEDRACFIIFGTFSYRSPVILLGFGWDGYQQLYVAPCRYYPAMYGISIIRHTFHRLTSTLMRDLIKLPSQPEVPFIDARVPSTPLKTRTAYSVVRPGWPFNL